MRYTTQDYITVCIPLRDHEEWTRSREEEVHRMLDALGNPLREDVQKKLDECDIVHFFSLNILPWDEIDKKAYLILEAVVDGEAQPGISRIVRAIGDDIFPIVQRAAGLTSREKLTEFLQSHHRGLRQNWLRFGNGKIPGLPFNGKAKLTVEKIRRNALISTEVRNELARRAITHPQEGPITRFQALKKHAETAAVKQGQMATPLTANNADDLPFADRRNAPWLEKAEDEAFGFLKQIRLVILGDAQFVMGAVSVGLLILYGYFLGLGVSRVLIDSVETWLFQASSGAASDRTWWQFFSALLGEEKLGGAGQIAWAIVVQFLTFIATFGLAAVTSAATLVFVALAGRRRLNWSESGDLSEVGSVRDGKVIEFNPKRNYPRDIDPDPTLVAEIMRRENHPGYVQNHMYHAVPMISGRFRRITLMFGFRAVLHALTAIGSMRPGFLGEVGTAHSVRWFIPPGSNRLVFCGNYDGNWESYLEAFITKASSGTNAIWSNAQGYPRTKDLFRKGAEDGDRLKRYARRTMMPSRCWYSAYPTLSLEQIRRQAIIFNGLCKIGDDNASAARAWLNLFDSVPRPDSWIEHDKIQSLMFGNQSDLTQAAMIAVNFGEIETVQDLEELQGWLYNRIVAQVTFGNSAPEERACYVAFSASGLIKLGLDELFKARDMGGDTSDAITRPDASEFAPAFGMGMASEARRRLLGDTNPETWQWGHGENEADMVLLLYWLDKSEKKRSLKALEKEVADQGYKVVKTLDISFSAKQKEREPFGFRDGLSQPIVRGFRKDNPPEDSIHLVEPGEFILGYRDNRGYFPPTPHIVIDQEKGSSPLAYLPALPDEMPQRYPYFPGREKMRDFGRNGSYLVIRQIEQYTDNFQKYASDLANNSSSALGTSLTAQDIKALMIGRWPDGNPLAKHPVGTSATNMVGTENDFLFGDTDPQGRRCPFGAHIRRANPRDSLNPTSENELEVSNRHRILRRGRPYWNGDGKNDKAQGLLFMALNADIERQFEFIQSTWLNSSSFHGLEGEQDPLFQPGNGKFTLPTSNGTNVFPNLAQFTSLQGGGYFFLPSKEALYYLTVSEPIRASGSAPIKSFGH